MYSIDVQYRHTSMDVCMYVWMHRFMDVWMYGRLDVHIMYVWMYGRIRI